MAIVTVTTPRETRTFSFTSDNNPLVTQGEATQILAAMGHPRACPECTFTFGQANSFQELSFDQLTALRNQPAVRLNQPISGKGVILTHPTGKWLRGSTLVLHDNAGAILVQTSLTMDRSWVKLLPPTFQFAQAGHYSIRFYAPDQTVTPGQLGGEEIGVMDVGDVVSPPVVVRDLVVARAPVPMPQFGDLNFRYERDTAISGLGVLVAPISGKIPQGSTLVIMDDTGHMLGSPYPITMDRSWAKLMPAGHIFTEAGDYSIRYYAPGTTPLEGQLAGEEIGHLHVEGDADPTQVRVLVEALHQLDMRYDAQDAPRAIPHSALVALNDLDSSAGRAALDQWLQDKSKDVYPVDLSPEAEVYVRSLGADTAALARLDQHIRMAKTVFSSISPTDPLTRTHLSDIARLLGFSNDKISEFERLGAQYRQTPDENVWTPWAPPQFLGVYFQNVLNAFFTEMAEAEFPMEAGLLEETRRMLGFIPKTSFVTPHDRYGLGQSRGWDRIMFLVDFTDSIKLMGDLTDLNLHAIENRTRLVTLAEFRQVTDLKFYVPQSDPPRLSSAGRRALMFWVSHLADEKSDIRLTSNVRRVLRDLGLDQTLLASMEQRMVVLDREAPARESAEITRLTALLEGAVKYDNLLDDKDIAEFLQAAGVAMTGTQLPPIMAHVQRIVRQFMEQRLSPNLATVRVDGPLTWQVLAQCDYPDGHAQQMVPDIRRRVNAQSIASGARLDRDMTRHHQAFIAAVAPKAGASMGYLGTLNLPMRDMSTEPYKVALAQFLDEHKEDRPLQFLLADSGVVNNIKLFLGDKAGTVDLYLSAQSSYISSVLNQSYDIQGNDFLVDHTVMQNLEPFYEPRTRNPVVGLTAEMVSFLDRLSKADPRVKIAASAFGFFFAQVPKAAEAVRSRVIEDPPT
jgi:hypothetical protein